MADRFDSFTEAARRVLALSQEEAQRLQHNYIGTEHVLLGLLAEGKGLSSQALEACGVDLARTRSAVEAMTGRGELPRLGEMGLTPRAKQVIELAVIESDRRHQDFIGPEHLLLGLLREEQGVAMILLGRFGVSAETVRAELDREMPPMAS